MYPRFSGHVLFCSEIKQVCKIRSKIAIARTILTCLVSSVRDVDRRGRQGRRREPRLRGVRAAHDVVVINVRSVSNRKGQTNGLYRSIAPQDLNRRLQEGEEEVHEEGMYVRLSVTCFARHFAPACPSVRLPLSLLSDCAHTSSSSKQTGEIWARLESNSGRVCKRGERTARRDQCIFTRRERVYDMGYVDSD